MTAVEKIRLVLASDLLNPSLVAVPAHGATDEQIDACERQLGSALPHPHREFLRAWNGIDLEILRLAGVPPVELGLQSLLDIRRLLAGVPELASAVPLGSDPTGFVFATMPDGSVCSWDHDGGAVQQLAKCLDDFVCHCVFGAESSAFMGEDWLSSLRARGLA